MLELKIGDRFEVERPEFGDIATYEVTQGGIRCIGVRKPEPPVISVDVSGTSTVVLSCSHCGRILRQDTHQLVLSVLTDRAADHLERKH